MVSWLIALSGHCSRDDYVLIVCYYGTDCSGRHLHPGVAMKIGVSMGKVSPERPTLQDWPCIWHLILGGTPQTGANGRVS